MQRGDGVGGAGRQEEFEILVQQHAVQEVVLAHLQSRVAVLLSEIHAMRCENGADRHLDCVREQEEVVLEDVCEG